MFKRTDIMACDAVAVCWFAVLAWVVLEAAPCSIYVRRAADDDPLKVRWNTREAPR